MQDRYVYAAIFDYADDGISVEFPDLPECLTNGKTDVEALQSAKEALGLHLWEMEIDHDPIPEPTPIKSIQPSGDRAGQKTHRRDDIQSLEKGIPQSG